MMTKAEFLSVRTNNFISLGLGTVTAFYILFVLVASVWSGKSEFIGLVTISAFL